VNVLILGATGGTGSIIATLLVTRGHQVTAVAREPEKLIEASRVKLVKCDVTVPGSLDRVMPGHDAVFLAVGSGDLKATTVRTDAARNTVAAMAKARVPRLIAMSGLGAGISKKSGGLFFEYIEGPLVYGRLLRDQNGLESEIRRSTTAWTIVRPGKMTDDPPKGNWAISLDGGGISRTVARHDVALFMVQQLDSQDYVRQVVAIGY
jgi:putative NADH-flavin reductase